MPFLYNIVIKFYSLALWLISPFNSKAKFWIKGREGLINKIANELDNSRKAIWFHFPSLGEFEQGRPVLEKIKEKYPAKRIVITFFSPSGYEVRKNYALAEYVTYLPVDNPRNAKQFIDLINPELAVFTKYDYWYYYFKELNERSIPLYLISAIFWKEQSFFRWYGALQRRMLGYVTTIFVQDQESKHLLNSIHVSNVIVAGDTRFDRVAATAGNPKTIPEAAAFRSQGDSPEESHFKIFVAGSTWPEDEKHIAPLVEEYPGWKFIIAPHEVSEARIDSLAKLFPEALRYSAFSSAGSVRDSWIMIIDTIGILSSVYQYGDIAYIGGGFGTGIHNTLEAAAFSLPVIFGPNYYKFREARELINEGAAFSIRNEDELRNAMMRLQDPERRSEAGRIAGKYVREHTGATGTIMSHIFSR